MIIGHRTIPRFTLVEMALALAILGVGLSAVLLLSTIGAKAGKDGRTENDLEGVAERMTVFLQARFSASGNWHDDGTSSAVIPDFVASPDDGDVPVGSGDFSPVAGQNGVLVKDVGTYICRQISSPDGVTVDFEAMVRVGQDNALPDAPVNKSFWKNQFYRSAADGTLKRLTDYPTTPTIPPAPAGTRIRGTSTADMFGKFYRPLIVEFSWPIDVVWSKREKRVIRMDIFNENFVPYPPSP